MNSPVDTDAIKAVLAQTNRLFKLQVSGVGIDDLLPQSLSVTESLGRDFVATIECISERQSIIEAKEVIGQTGTIELVRGDGSTRWFNGVVFSFQYVGVHGGMHNYHVELGPWARYLTLQKNYKIFQQNTTEEQVAGIFSRYPMADWSTHRITPDPEVTFAMQYDETDYNYLYRRIEERGWYTCYNHRPDGHTLEIWGDSRSAPPIEGGMQVRYFRDDNRETVDTIEHIQPIRNLAPTEYVGRSFDYKKGIHSPWEESQSNMQEQGQVPKLEVYEFLGYYAFKERDPGKEVTERRIQEIESGAKHFQGYGNCRRLMPGRTFQLTEHPKYSDEFLVLSVTHTAHNNYLTKESPSWYRNTFTCMRKSVPYRPGRGYNSVQPKVSGLHTAIVVGPEGEEIYTDKDGRVKVQFHFDRDHEYNQSSSCWIRVATSWAGRGFGAISLPRVDDEVLVQFLDADPDKPVITGSLYNHTHTHPWGLPSNKTQSGFLTRSYPHGTPDNANAFRFEDKKGQEQVWLHAERNQDIEVENNETHWVGQDRTKTIDRDETNHIKRDRTETVDNNETITIHNNRQERVDHNETISIGDNRTEDVGQNENVSIGGNRSVTIGGNKSETVKRAKTETITLAKALSIGMGYQTSVGAAMNTTVGLSQSEQVGVNKDVRVGKTYTINAGHEFKIIVGQSTLVMKSDGTVLINGTQFDFSASGPFQIVGKDVDIN